jgi:hypothetical protein
VAQLDPAADNESGAAPEPSHKGDGEKPAPPVKGLGIAKGARPNIQADNRVRIRIRRRRRTGRANILPEDDAIARNEQLSWANRTANRTLGTELLTIRVDLD